MIEPLVLLPGFMCDARLFHPQIDVFSRQRAVVVAPIGRGERIEEIASGLLDQLPHRFALAGHGLGGAVALELIRRAPDRMSRLCLIATNAQADTPQIAAGREDLIIGAQAGRLEEVMRKVVGSDALAPGPQRMPVLNCLMAMAMDLGPEVFCLSDACVAAEIGSTWNAAPDKGAQPDPLWCSRYADTCSQTRLHGRYDTECHLPCH